MNQKLNCRATFIHVLPLAASLCFIATSSVSAQQLVPAQFGERQDPQGFGWHLAMPYGGLNSDSRGCVSNGFVMSVGGSSPRFSQAQMTPDGITYLFTGSQSQRLEISRRVQFDMRNSQVQFIDSFRNSGTATVSTLVNLSTRLNNQAQAIVTDQGASFRGTLGPKETGFIAVAQPSSNIPTPVFFLADARSKVRPTVTVQNNYQFVFAYSISVPPGKTVSLAYGMAQTNLSTPPDAAAAAKLLKPFNDPTWLRQVPSDIRKTVVNAATGGFGAYDDSGSIDAVAELGERGPHDMLLVGEVTRLRGTLSSAAVEIESKLGRKNVPLERIAAVFGGNQRGRMPKLVLRDGQVLVGPVEMKELKFVLNSGLDVTCDLSNIDRFVFRQAPDDGKPVPEVFAYVDLVDGDRLAVKRGSPQKLMALTAWGGSEVAVEEIELWSSANPSQGMPAHRLVLRDGSEFSTMLAEGSLQFADTEFGSKTWSVFDIRRLRSAHRGKADADRVDPTAPHVVLAGENRFVGQIDLSLLHLIVQGQTIPVAPAQLKSLRRDVQEKTGLNGEPAAEFVAEMWDGDTAVGVLKETVLPLRTIGGVLQVPVSDLVEFRTPTPTVPESLRGRINDLLTDLGHAEWKRREDAGKELRSLGAVIKEQGQEVLQTTTDPEVRKRLQTLLDALRE